MNKKYFIVSLFFIAHAATCYASTSKRIVHPFVKGAIIVGSAISLGSLRYRAHQNDVKYNAEIQDLESYANQLRTDLKKECSIFTHNTGIPIKFNEDGFILKLGKKNELSTTPKDNNPTVQGGSDNDRRD